MKKFLILMLLSLIASGSHAQLTDTLKRIDALFSSWNNATPGGAVAIMRGDKIIYHKAFGLADLEHNVPNTTETIFESGSVAKQFTATALLLLADQGRVALTDDVRKYVPELPVYDKVITIHHLLNHTSGLKDWGSVGSLTGWPRTTRNYTQDLALRIMSKQKSTNFTPGAQYSYSNSNYSLLVTIVERVSKKSLAQFTDSVFFKPLKMTKTQWRDNFQEVVLNRSIAYSGREGNYQQLMPFENVHGHGGLLTTTADLLKWNKLLEPNTIISNRVMGWRIQKGKLNDGSEITYASGLVNRMVNGFQEISHSGATAGYRAWLAYYPQKKLSVVILSNDGGYRDVSGQVAELFLGKEIRTEQPAPTKFIQLTESEKKNWAGVYRRAEGFDIISFEYKNNQLLNNGREVKSIHRDTLYLDRFYWIRQSSEKILLKNQNGTNSYTRVVPADTSPLALQALQGVYTSDEAEASYTISAVGSELFLQVEAHPKKRLIPIYRHAYRDDDFVLYEFKSDKNNRVTALSVSVSRALNVPFIKK